MIAEQIKRLRKLQHLVLIRDEAAKVGSGERLDELGASIEKALTGLEPEALALYKRQSAHSHIFMAPIAKGNCSACGLKLPTSILQHVIGVSRYVTCSSCGRILYLPEVKATGIRPNQPDPHYLLSRFSAQELMVSGLKATTKAEAIAELCDVLAEDGALNDRDAAVKAALEREKILSTAVGAGLAFPHMRGVEEGVLTFAAGLSKKGIDWDGDGNLVNLVIFTALPIVASPFYLKLLAAFATSFEGGDRLPFVTAAEDDRTLWKELNKATRVAMKKVV